jgi:hypothetical protein
MGWQELETTLPAHSVTGYQTMVHDTLCNIENILNTWPQKYMVISMKYL